MKLTSVLVVFAAFFWAANFFLAPMVMADLSPLWAAAIRFLLGAALMFAIALRRREAVAAVAQSHGKVLALLGVVGIAGFNIFFFFALQSTSAVNAALIMASNPLLTTLLATSIGEKISARQLAAIPLALCGVIVVIRGQGAALAHVSQGDLLMLCANFAWACYNVLGRRFLPKGSPAGSSALMMIAGAILLLTFALAAGGPVSLPGEGASLALLVMVLFGTVAAYLFWNAGIAKLGAGKTALFVNLIPVFVMLIEAATGSLPSATQLLGGLLVVGGVSLAMIPVRSAAARGSTA